MLNTIIILGSLLLGGAAFIGIVRILSSELINTGKKCSCGEYIYSSGDHIECSCGHQYYKG